jgi:hypothetical protein
MSGVHQRVRLPLLPEAHDREFVRQLDMFLIASQGKKPLPISETYPSRLALEGSYCLSKRISNGDNYLVMAMKLCTNSAAVEMVDDLSGPLPLHVAARYPVRTMPQQWPHKMLLPLEPLKSLMQMCPKQFVVACKRTDSSGRLALHIALDQGRRGWWEGIEDLVASAPESLWKGDPVTGLLPFQLAAAATSAEPDTKGSSAETNRTETIFLLLLACPHACRVADGAC